MNLQTFNRSNFKKLTLVVAGTLGLLTYGHFVMVPGYEGVIDEYRSFVIRNQPRAHVAPPTPQMMKSMMSKLPPMAPAGEHHRPLRMVVDIPGVTQPNLVEAESTTLSNDASVIGIVVNGKSYAFAHSAMLHPKQIVNLLIDHLPISVTYCDFADCVRVLKRNEGRDPIGLRIGGLDVSNQMVILLNGIRYGQSAASIPLQDLPFERTTLGEWKLLHPETMIYEG